MKIGIIVFSHTGNTYTIAQKLQDKLSSKGHTVNIERITHKGSNTPDIKNVQLDERPDVDKYDVVVFGSPVWGFSLSSVMTAYLTQISTFQNKKIACFVTKSLPFSWTGGNRAIMQMKKIIESKNANVCGTEIVTQSSIKNDTKLKDVIEKLSKYIV
jgi:NAD(P)H dehydrogenase (quinone)